MEKEVLIDENTYPDNNVLNAVLGEEQFNIYLNFLERVKNLNLVIEWRFYKDTKTWLGKILNKSKNIGWISIWNVGFKVTIFFNEKTINGLYELSLHNNLDVFTDEVKPTSKLMPLRTTINNRDKLVDIIKILVYKKNLK